MPYHYVPITKASTQTGERWRTIRGAKVHFTGNKADKGPAGALKHFGGGGGKAESKSGEDKGFLDYLHTNPAKGREASGDYIATRKRQRGKMGDPGKGAKYVPTSAAEKPYYKPFSDKTPKPEGEESSPHTRIDPKERDAAKERVKAKRAARLAAEKKTGDKKKASVAAPTSNKAGTDAEKPRFQTHVADKGRPPHADSQAEHDARVDSDPNASLADLMISTHNTDTKEANARKKRIADRFDAGEGTGTAKYKAYMAGKAGKEFGEGLTMTDVARNGSWALEDWHNFGASRKKSSEKPKKRRMTSKEKRAAEFEAMKTATAARAKESEGKAPALVRRKRGTTLLGRHVRKAIRLRRWNDDLLDAMVAALS